MTIRARDIHDLLKKGTTTAVNFGHYRRDNPQCPLPITKATIEIFPVNNDSPTQQGTHVYKACLVSQRYHLKHVQLKNNQI